MLKPVKVTACVLTFNESDFIEGCLQHLRPHVDYLYVLDGFSSDATVTKARRYADATYYHEFSGSIATERNYIQKRAPTDWVLHCDADERFHSCFLKNMKPIIQISKVKCFRFPRVNLDKDYPQTDLSDPQVRLLDKRAGVWVRAVHEIVWSVEFDKPLDQCGDAHVKYLSQYPIIHLARSKDQRKQILERWKQISTQQNQ